MNDPMRPFPIQRDLGLPPGRDPAWFGQTTVPWWIAELAYVEYSRRYGTLQSLERLAERGGFSRAELVAFLKDATLPTPSEQKTRN
jgi:hypothetical protein